MSQYCPQCGKELPDDAMFCQRCGKPLQGATQLSAQPQPQWEYCTIEREGGSSARFYAQAMGPRGTYKAAQSGATSFLGLGTQSGDEAVLNAFINDLIASGWEPLPEHGAVWYSHKFRRSLGQNSASTAPDLVGTFLNALPPPPPKSWLLRKKTIFWLSLLFFLSILLAGVSGIFLQSSPSGLEAGILVILAIVGTIFGLVAWVAGIVRAAKMQSYGWLIAIFLFVFWGALFYGIFGPKD